MTRFRFALASILVIPLIVRADEPPKIPPEFSWMPANAVAFLHVHFAQLWNDPKLRDAIRGENRKQMEETLALSLDQIDRITLVVPDTEGTAPEESIIVRITTKEPYDPQRVRAIFWKGSGRDPSIRPLSKIIELPHGGGVAYLNDNRNIYYAFAQQRSLELLQRLARPAKTGNLVPALALAAENHAVVGAVDMPHARHVLWLTDIPEMRRLFIARSALLVGDLTSEGLKLQLRFKVGLRTHGEEVLESLQNQQTLALNALTTAEKSREEPAMKRMLAAIASVVKAARIEMKAREVVATAVMPSTEPLAAVAVDALDGMRMSGYRARSQMNLKMMGLAFHNFHDTVGHFPAGVFDPKGKPLLSWRVQILPYMEEDQLYRQFKLDEPWDSEHNKKLIERMPKFYALPGDRKKHAQASTYYRIFNGKGALADGNRKVRMQQVTDGLSNTLLVVEAADAVPWTKPDEIEYDPKQVPKLGYYFGDRANVLYCDGAVGTIRRTFNPVMLHRLIQRSDGNVVERPD